MKTRWLKNLTVIFASAVLGLGAAPAGALPTDPEPAVLANSGTPNHETMLGDFAGPVWQDDTTPEGVKLVDVDATLDALEEAKVNTYAYAISGLPGYGDGTAGPLEITQTQWEQLPEFAEAAADRNIDVYPYLTPPSLGALDTGIPRPEQEPGMAPYGWDYIAWAEATAELSLEHPNIGGLFIDDFDANTTLRNSPYSFAFTPDYVAQMSNAAKQHAPDFKIYGVVYYQSLGVASHFRSSLDGVVFPYRAHTGEPGTADASKVRDEGEVYGDLTHCNSDGDCLQFSSFASAESGGTATAHTVIDVQQGVQHDLQIALNHDHYLPTCDDGRCYEFSVPDYAPTENGDFFAISQEVELTEGGPHRLSFWTGAINSSLEGYHILEALVDGQVVATRDINEAAGPKEFDIDVTEYVAESDEATLTFRLHNPVGVQNYTTQFFLDNIELTNAEVIDGSFGEPTSNAWSASSEGGVISGGYTAEQHVIEILVDGRVVETFPVEGYSRWTTHSANVTPHFLGASTAELEIRIRGVGTDSARHVWVDDMSISGTNLDLDAFDDPATWTFSSEAETSVEFVTSFETLFMTYADSLSGDAPGHTPSPEYIREVQAAGLQMTQGQFFDGSLIYVLNLTEPLDHPDGVERRVIGELHGDFLATDPAACDVVLTEPQRNLNVHEGRTCVIGSELHGGTTVASDAEMTIMDSQIRGNLTSNGSIALCASSQGGSLNIAGAREVRLGATPELCAGNNLRGSTTVSETTGAFVVADNVSRGSLHCTGNASDPATRGSTNEIHGSASGQCAAL